MNADGSDQTRLTHSGGERPVWSPDGKYILFSGLDGLNVMNADGSALARIPVEGVHPGSLIDWTQ
jgi:Tol biopolymer transport system component